MFQDPEEVALWDGLLHFVKVHESKCQVSHVASRPTSFEISTAFQQTLRFDLNANLGRPSLDLSLDESNRLLTHGLERFDGALCADRTCSLV